MLNHLSTPDSSIGYSVRISTRAKRARIEVTAIGKVNVVVPTRFNHKLIPEFIAQNQAWLYKTLKAIPNRAALHEARPSYFELRALSEYWTLSDDTQPDAPLISVDETNKHIGLNMAVNIRRTLQRWLHHYARIHLSNMLACKSDELGLPFANVYIKNQKTRWGSCSSKGNINLNRNLLFLPRPLVEYLFVHELCHTIHMNHSSSYWLLVKSHLPNFQDYDKQLRHAVHFIPTWALPEN